MKFVGVVLIATLHQAIASTLVTKSINQFVTRIDTILTHDNEFNSVLCPFNLHLGLSVLYQGAGGGTEKELSSLLGLPESKKEVTTSYKTLLDKLTGDSFRTWTCMIPGENFDLKQGFVGAAYKYFKAGAAGASQVNNGTASDVTLKYCNNIGSRPRTTKLQIFSKAGFNSSWRTPFTFAEEGDFLVSPKDKVNATIMRLDGTFPYKEDHKLGARVLELDYVEEGWRMLLVLPENIEAGLSSLQSRISESPLTNLLEGLKEVKLEASIPKFSTNAFKFHRDMKFLEKMGAKALFSNNAEFPDVSEDGNMHLSHVLIEAFIAVNETATLAGSGADLLAGGGDDLPQIPQPPPSARATVPVTPSSTSAGTSAPSFNANRPFLFYIVGPSDVFLYSGKIVNPVNQKS